MKSDKILIGVIGLMAIGAFAGARFVLKNQSAQVEESQQALKEAVGKVADGVERIEKKLNDDSNKES